MALLIRCRNFAVGADRHAVGDAEPAANHFQVFALGVKFHDRAVVIDFRGQGVTRRLGEVEIAVRAAVEIERELVEMVRGVEIVVEVFVEIGLAVVVEVVQDGDLVAVQDIDFSIDHFDALRLMEARGEAPPRQFVEVFVDAVDDPDIARPGCHRGAVVVEEVEISRPEPRFPRVFERQARSRPRAHGPESAPSLPLVLTVLR